MFRTHSPQFAALLTVALASCLANATPLHAQAGLITDAASASFDPQLDPDGLPYITASGAAFTSGTTEHAEFELPTHIVGDWVPIFDVSEAGNDITPACAATDIVGDADGGDIGWWAMTDPTPGAPRSGDEHLVLRVRIADAVSGSSGVNFLFSTDGLYGSGIDANAVAGNQGFEYEIQFATGGGKKGVSGWNVDGAAVKGTENCSQCIALADVQRANAAAAGGCTGTSPTFVTFAYELALLPAGLQSDVDPLDLFVGLGTTASGNGGTLLGGGNVKDYGAFADNSLPADCNDASGAARFDCLMEDAFEAQQAALPVRLLGLRARAGDRGTAEVTWVSADESAFRGYLVERSRDGREFTEVGFVPARGTDGPAGRTRDYAFTDRSVGAGTVYYRLGLLDADGSVAFSRTVGVSLELPGLPGFGVSPNPVRRGDELTVRLDGTPGGVEVLLTDVRGRRVWSGTTAAGSVAVPTAGLTAGLYALNVGNDGTYATQRVVVQ